MEAGFYSTNRSYVSSSNKGWLRKPSLNTQVYRFCSDCAFSVWSLEIFGEVWDGSCFSGCVLRKIQLPIACVIRGSRNSPQVSTESKAIGKVLYLLPLGMRISLMWQCPPPRQSRNNLLLSLNPFAAACMWPKGLGSAEVLMGMWCLSQHLQHVVGVSKCLSRHLHWNCHTPVTPLPQRTTQVGVYPSQGKEIVGWRKGNPSG